MVEILDARPLIELGLLGNDELARARSVLHTLGRRRTHTRAELEKRFRVLHAIGVVTVQFVTYLPA